LHLLPKKNILKSSLNALLKALASKEFQEIIRKAYAK
jgi:hypothetical protein